MEIVYLAEVDSTNAEAERYALAHPGCAAAFLAGRQTAGKGSRGRSFSSPAGGMYLSLLLPASLLARTDPTALTAYTAAVATDAIGRACGVRPGIKWVNDLWLGGRKIAGILAEGKFDTGGTLDRVVIGIGVNLRRGSLPSELAPIATDVETETGKILDPRTLAADFLAAFMRSVGSPDAPEWLSLYRAASVLIDRDVTVAGRGEPYIAHVLAIENDYGLRVRRADGGEEILHSGEVSIRLPQ